MARYDTIPHHTTPYHPTGILYAIDAKISVLIKISATDGPIGLISTAPNAGASGRAGGDSRGDPENDWWIAVVGGAAAGLGVLSVAFCVSYRCRGNGIGKGAPTKKASVEDGGGGRGVSETKGESKAEAIAEAMAQRA